MNNQAPKKVKNQVNQKPHINSVLRNAIMKYTELKNKANKTNSANDLKNTTNNEIWWLNQTRILKRSLYITLKLKAIQNRFEINASRTF